MFWKYKVLDKIFTDWDHRIEDCIISFIVLGYFPSISFPRWTSRRPVGTFQLTATKKTMTTAGLGVPVKLLHESLGHIITVELKTGQLYRGKLAEGMFKSLARCPTD